jgi:hypothetical protein
MRRTKNCLTCKHWQDTNKTVDIHYRYELDSKVSRKVGKCLLDNSNITESYYCGQYEDKNDL